MVNWSLMLKHRHTHASIYSRIWFVSPDQQCGYELQFVDVRYRNTTEEKMASISIKRNCFSMELKAEIINAVDLKRKTKAQIYRDYKYNIKMFAWNTLYLLERQRSHETQSKGPWYTVVTSAIKIVISIQVSQPQCRMSAPLYDVSRCIHWHFDAGLFRHNVVLFDWLPKFNEVGSRLV